MCSMNSRFACEDRFETLYRIWVLRRRAACATACGYAIGRPHRSVGCTARLLSRWVQTVAQVGKTTGIGGVLSTCATASGLPRDSSPQFGDRHLFEIRATPMGSNPRAFHKKASPRDSLHDRTWRREGDSGPLRSPSPRGLAAPCALRWQTAPPFPQLRALAGSNPCALH